MTDKKTEALKLALEALRDYRRSDDDRVSVAMGILQEALAEQQMESPCRCKKQSVAWCMASGCSKAEQPAHAQTIKDQEAVIHRLQKRYADLEAKVGKPWVGLTKAEVDSLTIYPMNPTADLVKAIEAKLKEKNHG